MPTPGSGSGLLRNVCKFCNIRYPVLAGEINIKLSISSQFVNLAGWKEKWQTLLNLQLKWKIVKLVKFVAAFNPGHKWVSQIQTESLWSPNPLDNMKKSTYSDSRHFPTYFAWCLAFWRGNLWKRDVFLWYFYGWIGGAQQLWTPFLGS